MIRLKRKTCSNYVNQCVEIVDKMKSGELSLSRGEKTTSGLTIVWGVDNYNNYVVNLTEISNNRDAKSTITISLVTSYISDYTTEITLQHEVVNFDGGKRRVIGDRWMNSNWKAGLKDLLNSIEKM